MAEPNLAGALEEMLADVWPLPDRLAAAEADPAPGGALRSVLVETGWPGIALAEPHGFGLTGTQRAELAVAAGRRLLPGAFREEAFTLVPALAAAAAADGWAAERLTGVLSGALAGAAGQLTGQSGAPFSVAGDRVTVSLDAVPVYRFAEPPQVIAVRAGDQTVLLDPTADRARLSPVAVLERGQGTALLSCTCTVPVTRLVGGAAGRAIRSGWELAVFGELVGCGDAVLSQALAHATDRHQFGRPIAHQQAVAHLLADMRMGLEIQRSAVARAALLVDEDPDEYDRLRLALRCALPGLARDICEQGIQVAGGMGFTWEYGLHLHYRRVLALQAALGGAVGSAVAAGRGLLARQTGASR